MRHYPKSKKTMAQVATSDAVKTLSQRQEEVHALFETQEELEAYIKALHEAPTESTEEVKLNKIGKEGGDQLIISTIL
jgi:hypothetical protein